MRTEILLFDGFDELDGFGPFEVLADAGFETSFVTLGDERRVVAAHGAVVMAHGPLSERPELLIVPGGGWLTRSPQGAWAEAERGDVPAAIAERHAAGTQIAAVCTGGMLVARAGLLDGRPAITHHSALDDLAASGAEVIRDARVVDDGDVLTAGGVTSGIDLALWIVERELGTERANATAAHLEHRRHGDVYQRTGTTRR